MKNDDTNNTKGRKRRLPRRALQKPTRRFRRVPPNNLLFPIEPFSGDVLSPRELIFLKMAYEDGQNFRIVRKTFYRPVNLYLIAMLYSDDFVLEKGYLLSKDDYKNRPPYYEGKLKDNAAYYSFLRSHSLNGIAKIPAHLTNVDFSNFPIPRETRDWLINLNFELQSMEDKDVFAIIAFLSRGGNGNGGNGGNGGDGNGSDNDSSDNDDTFAERTIKLMRRKGIIDNSHR